MEKKYRGPRTSSAGIEQGKWLKIPAIHNGKEDRPDSICCGIDGFLVAARFDVRRFSRFHHLNAHIL
jgi:hypothetical protein